MSVLKEIENIYSEIENRYAQNQFQALAAGKASKVTFWEQKRELNTHAYFLFLFTRLENHVKEKSQQLITDRKASITHWKTKAIWEIPDSRLHFMKRVGLLTEINEADYRLILQYYKYRNTIAHGGSIQGIMTVIVMPQVFIDMRRLFRVLKR